jgi:hypothetical protein
MKFDDYIRGLEGQQLNKNSWSDFGRKQTNLFLERYSFLESRYADFLTEIGGLEVYSSKYLLVLYGFALSEAELVYPVDQYLRDREFLAIGEYTEKRESDKWKGVGYFYRTSDKSPVIYMRFYQEENEKIANRYFPSLIGFGELLGYCTAKSYKEQLNLATGGEYSSS